VVGAAFASMRASPRPSLTNASRQPRLLLTMSPSLKLGLRERSTRPTAPPSSGSPSLNGGEYDFTSFMRPRIYGSTDM